MQSNKIMGYILLCLFLILCLMEDESQFRGHTVFGAAVGKHLYRLLKKSRFVPIPILIPVHHSHHSEHHHHHHHKKHGKHHGRIKRQSPLYPHLMSMMHQQMHQQRNPYMMGHPPLGSPMTHQGHGPGLGLSHMTYPMSHPFQHMHQYSPHHRQFLMDDRRRMFMAVLRASLRLYVRAGFTVSALFGTMYMAFGSAFTQVVQHMVGTMGTYLLNLSQMNFAGNQVVNNHHTNH